MNTMIKVFTFLLLTSSVYACSSSVVAARSNASVAKPEFALTKEESSCKADDDCAFIATNCCGCNQGGKQTAVNKNFEGAAKARLAISCGGVMCVQMMSTDPSCVASAPICAEGVCTVPK